MNWNIPTILFHFHGNFQHKNSISKPLQFAYPSYHCAWVKDPLFCGVLILRTHLLYTICFQTCTKEKRFTRASGICAPILWEHHSHVAQNLAQAREKEHQKEQILNDGLLFWELSQVLSSFFLSMFPDMERGKVNKSLLQGFFSLCCLSV